MTEIRVRFGFFFGNLYETNEIFTGFFQTGNHYTAVLSARRGSAAAIDSIIKCWHFIMRGMYIPRLAFAAPCGPSQGKVQAARGLLGNMKRWRNHQKL